MKNQKGSDFLYTKKKLPEMVVNLIRARSKNKKFNLDEEENIPSQKKSIIINE